MTYLIVAIVGCVVGGLLLKDGGFVFGGVIGCMLVLTYNLASRLNSLEEDQKRMRERLQEMFRELRKKEPAEQPSDSVMENEAVFRWNAAAADRFQTSPLAEIEKQRFEAKTEKEDTEKPQPEWRPAVRPDPAKMAAEPSGFEQSINSFFTGGNLLVKLGMAILFIGISFLVKYAVQHGMFPIELRLMGAAAGGIGLLATGWYLRGRRAEYALVLQGGGIGVLYLTTYGAMRLYHLIPAIPAFTILVLISALCGTLAVIQSSRTMALFGISGGFLAPFLASVGTGDPALLFGYYTVLNIGIIGIAWFRSWRILNLAGFVSTFILSAIWGACYYKPVHFASVEPFLILFFVIYLAVPVIFAFRQPPDIKGYLDATILFGTPAAAFILQSALVSDYRYGMAWSCLAAGLCYLLLASMLWKRGTLIRPLAEAFQGLGGIMLTLSVPLAFDGRITSAVWALEGAAMVWAGFRTDRRLVRLSGYIMQLLGGAAFITAITLKSASSPILNSIFLGTLMISLAGIFTGYLIAANKRKTVEWEQPLEYLFIAWCLCWWCAGGVREIEKFVLDNLTDGVTLLYVAISAGMASLISRQLKWQSLSFASLLLLPLMVIAAFLWLPAHPLAHGGWFAWPVAFASAWWILYGNKDSLSSTLLPYPHASLVWLLALLGSWELSWQVHMLVGGAGSWFEISRVVVPLILTGLIIIGSRFVEWPIKQNIEAYLGLSIVPLAIWSLLWVVYSAFSCSGDSWPLQWVPVFNQVDLAMIMAIGIPIFWLRTLDNDFRFSDFTTAVRPFAVPLFSGVIFIWLNSLLARALYHWGGVGFTADAMLASPLAQACFSVFWSLLALVAMLRAVSKGLRNLWITGAVLLGSVVAKLFMVDLAGHGTVSRIVSFVAVGLLLLVIGWFAPVPPSEGSKLSEAQFH